MVNRGPARGCQRCKDRHIKCDLKRPKCWQCVRLNFNCPGYGHDLDPFLRNQTTSVVSRHRPDGHGRQQQRRRRLTTDTEDSNSTTQRMRRPSIREHLSPSLESCALNFLFTTGTLLYRKDDRLSHGHLDFLQPRYQDALPESPLALATTWLAFIIMGSHTSDRYWVHYSECSQLMTRAIQGISNAIRDPVDNVKDETLSAVILLAYGEYLYLQSKECIGKVDARFTIHQDGAEALIRRRGLLNFQDTTSIALFDAVRHNAFNLAFAGIRSARKNWDLWTLDDMSVRQLCDSYTPATELDACGVAMLSLKSDLASDDLYLRVNLRRHLVQLLGRLRCWTNAIPSDWLIARQQSLEVCYMFNQWHLLQIAVGHLLKELDMKTNGTRFLASDFSDELNCIDSLMASEPLLMDPGMSNAAVLAGTTPLSEIAATNENWQGSRLFKQMTEKFDLIMTDALVTLILPQTVAMCYREVLAWIRKDRDVCSRLAL